MEIKQKNKRHKQVVVGLILIFLVVVTLLANLSKGEDLRIVKQKAVTLSENWTLNYENIMIPAAKLPVNLELSPGTEYQASIVLPSVDDNMNYLLLRSSMQDILVYLDDDEIYRYQEPLADSHGIQMPVASTWLMFDLPADFQGKTLKLVIESDIAAFSGIINQAYLGESASLIYNLFKQSFSGFLIFLFLLIVGLLAILSSIVIKNVKDNRLLYLGLLAISTGIWILSEARIMQFFTGNRYIIGSSSYLMVFLMAIFFALYFKETILISDKSKKHMQGVAGVYLLGLMTTMLLQISGRSSFFESMRFIWILILLSIVFLLVLIGFEIVKQKNQNAKKFLKYLSVLILSIFFEGVVFYNHYFDYTSFFLRIGILIFFVLLLLDSYHYLKKNFESQRERDILEKLAYQDALTGANNRAAFERDLNELMNKEEAPFILALLDLNDLKYINDQYGHRFGDDAIKSMYAIINKVFSSIGVCYRIGGDEFTILTDNTDTELFQFKIQEVREQLAQEESRQPYPFAVAVGMAVYDCNIWPNETKFYHYVDQKMYADKQKQKENKKIE